MVAVQTARFSTAAHGARFARIGDRDPPPTPAPELGQHSRETLHDLGLAPHEINRLFDHGVTSEPSARPRSGQSGPAV